MLPTHIELLRLPEDLRPALFSTGSGTNDGPVSQAGVVHPVALASDASGSLYLAEYTTGRVRRLDPGGNLTTRFHSSLGASARFRDFAADAIGNCYYRSDDSSIVYKIHANGQQEVIHLPIEDMAVAPLNNANCCNSATRRVLDLAIMPNGGIYCLLRVDFDYSGSSRWSVVTAIFGPQMDGIPTMLGTPHRFEYYGGFGLGVPRIGGSQLFAIYPTVSSEPVSESAIIPEQMEFGTPSREMIASVPRSLAGGTFAPSADPDTYLLNDGSGGHFVIRDGGLSYLVRGFLRKVYDGRITSMAALADGTYLATDGARLLRFYPYSVDGKLQISRMPGSPSHQLMMMASDAARYDIQASGDLRGWTTVATGLQGGGTYSIPPELDFLYFRAQASGN
jgi:hypothetical protein